MGVFVAIIFVPKDLLPWFYSNIAGDYPRLFILAVLSIMVFLWRLMACILFYRKKVHIRQWVYALLIAMIVLLLQIQLYDKLEHKLALEQLMIAQPERYKNFFHLFSSELELTIDGDGDGRLVRNQVFEPMEDLWRIPEYDFFTSGGGLTINDFTYEIRKVIDKEVGPIVESDKQACVVPDNPKRFKMLYNTILDGHLIKGQKYSRMTTVHAVGAFIDTISDGLLVNVNHPTDVIRIKVYFTNGRKIDTNKVRITKTHAGGAALQDPENVGRQIVLQDDRVDVTLDELQVGDKFGVFWQYTIPPR
ncbi:MAG: hypothetical protein NT002_09690 [candidate division Zixibacteria bacterium]|nr:hypothetical protein [candidate division Zixibacteria bacterium]